MNTEEFENLLGKWMPNWAEVSQSYAGRIKPPTMEGLQMYLYEGVPMGGFLQAVMNNDLFQAVGRADSENRESLYAIVQLIYNEFPNAARNYDEWLSLHAGRVSA